MNNKLPIIGVTADIQSNSHKYTYDSNSPWYALRKNYIDVIANKHGAPILLPDYDQNITHILPLLDGIMVTGNVYDIDPKFYSEKISKAQVDTSISNRTKFELALVTQAIEMNIPVFGICNGMQIINVVRGGSLIQDIETHISSNIAHKTESILTTSHNIKINSGTKLHLIADKSSESIVNSSHHQAIKELGKNLIVSAIAEDGIIEGIESTQHDFVLGVQWHPEFLSSQSLDNNLFETFIEAAAQYKLKKICIKKNIA